jgi:hypothetical protein
MQPHVSWHAPLARCLATWSSASTDSACCPFPPLLHRESLCVRTKNLAAGVLAASFFAYTFLHTRHRTQWCIQVAAFIRPWHWLTGSKQMRRVVHSASGILSAALAYHSTLTGEVRCYTQCTPSRRCVVLYSLDVFACRDSTIFFFTFSSSFTTRLTTHDYFRKTVGFSFINN